MSEKYCCVTWSELAPELIVAKEQEIQTLMEDKGLPRSVFASVFKVLAQMQNYCPVCGSGSDSLTVPPTREQIPVSVKQVSEVRTKVAKPAPRKKCERCGGKAILGHEGKDNYLGSGINIKCMNCHGKGWVDGRESVSETEEEKAHEEAVAKRIEEFEQGEDNGN